MRSPFLSFNSCSLTCFYLALPPVLLKASAGTLLKCHRVIQSSGRLIWCVITKAHHQIWDTNAGRCMEEQNRSPLKAELHVCCSFSCLWVRAAEEVVEAVSGSRGQAARQPDRGLLGGLMYLLALPYSHDSVPTPEPVCLVTWDETKPNVCCPRLPLHLSREGLYYSPRAVNHSAVDTIRQFHQAHLQAAGRGC